MPSLSSFCAVENPFMPFSIIKAVMPLEPAVASVLAYTTSVSATVPLVIHILLPLMTKRSPFFSARVAIDTTSLPAPGSDIAKEPTCSPEISFGRYFRFCASLPLRRISLTQRLECPPYDRPPAAQAHEIPSPPSQRPRPPTPVAPHYPAL